MLGALEETMQHGRDHTAEAEARVGVGSLLGLVEPAAASVERGCMRTDLCEFSRITMPAERGVQLHE